MIAALLSLVSSSSLVLSFLCRLVSCFLLVSLGLTLVSPLGLCLFLVWIIAHVIGLPLLSSPLDIVRWIKTHACPTITLVSCLCYTRLLLFDPACVLTMFTNKSLHFDPLASCPVGSVTDTTSLSFWQLLYYLFKRTFYLKVEFRIVYKSMIINSVGLWKCTNQ